MDANILLYIQDNIRCTALNAMLIPLTHAGDAALIWLFIAAVLFIRKSTRKTSYVVFASLFLTWIINDHILKVIINRPRPFDTVKGLLPLIRRPFGSSFPSGHTATSFAAAVAILLTSQKKIGIPVLCLSIIMALSRLYVGVHYPTDVLAGCATGTLSATGCVLFFRRKSNLFGDKIQKNCNNRTKTKTNK